MKILVEVDDTKVAKKILTIISLFQDEGVKVKELDELEQEGENLSFSEKHEKSPVKKDTEFLEFLYGIYKGKNNISALSDEEALEDALRDKYGL